MTLRLFTPLVLIYTLEIVFRVLRRRYEIALRPSEETLATKPFLNHRAENEG